MADNDNFTQKDNVTEKEDFTADPALGKGDFDLSTTAEENGK